MNLFNNPRRPRQAEASNKMTLNKMGIGRLAISKRALVNPAWWGAFLLGAVLLTLAPLANAFPPAPYHLIYGVVRDKYGTPLSSDKSQIILLNPGGAQVKGDIIPGYSPGINYQIKVPIDSGITSDLYRPNAMVTSHPFRILIVINGVTNTPIELQGLAPVIGLPGKTTHIDLTLGTDSGSDGIPDEWERAFLAAIGTNVPLSSLNPNSVLTPDGLTLRQQFLLGTYLFDPDNPLKITHVGLNTAHPMLQFPTITGRSYTIQGTADFRNWKAVSFTLSTDANGSQPRSFYYAPGIGRVQAYIVPPAPGTPVLFYRVMVQ